VQDILINNLTEIYKQHIFQHIFSLVTSDLSFIDGSQKCIKDKHKKHEKEDKQR
jgi:hypothetical protein